MKAWKLQDLADEREASGQDYLEFLRVPDMNAGLYELKAGQQDRQSPHTEDEVYYVIEGSAAFRAADETTAVGPGSVLYVSAGVEHRFEEITKDLRILVVFASKP